jgi:hypothetical protein
VSSRLEATTPSSSVSSTIACRGFHEIFTTKRLKLSLICVRSACTMWLSIASLILIANYCSAWVPQQRASLERPQPLHRHRPHLRMQTCVSDTTTANPHRRRAFLRAIPCSIAAVAAVSSTRPSVAANLVEDLTTTAPALTLRARVAKKLVDFPAGGSTACIACPHTALLHSV